MERLIPLLCVRKYKATAGIRLAFLRIKTENKGTIASPVISMTISWPEAVTSWCLNIHLAFKKKNPNGATERRKEIRLNPLLKVKNEVKGKHTKTGRNRLSGQRIKAHRTAPYTLLLLNGFFSMLGIC